MSPKNTSGITTVHRVWPMPVSAWVRGPQEGQKFIRTARRPSWNLRSEFAFQIGFVRYKVSGTLARAMSSTGPLPTTPGLVLVAVDHLGHFRRILNHAVGVEVSLDSSLLERAGPALQLTQRRRGGTIGYLVLPFFTSLSHRSL